MACAGLLAAAGCDEDKKGGDADTDVIPDYLPEMDVTPDPAGDPDVTVDPDVTIDPDVVPEIIDTTPDSTGCTPLHGGVCSVIDNCGCDAGQICTFGANTADPCDVDEICVASTGTLATGADCDPANDQCAPGNSCLTNSLTGESKCYKWCDGDEDCSAGHSCTITISFDMGGTCTEPVTLEYMACDLGCPADAACDPFTGTGCSGTTNSCLYDFDCALLFCAPSGAHAVGEDCSDTGLCVIGAECLTTDGGVTNTCMAFCDDSHACTSGTCTVLSPAYSGNPSLGACIPG